MTIETLLLKYESHLETLDTSLNNDISKINETFLVNDQQFLGHFQQELVEESEELTKLNLAQLNTKYETLDEDIREVGKLAIINDNLKELEILLSKKKAMSDLLDFQQLFNLFKTLKSQTPNDSSLLIHKHISKTIDTNYDQLITQLNEYSQLLIPNEFSIENIHILNEFNLLVVKNGISLASYTKLKVSLEKTITKMLSSSKYDILLVDDKLADYDSISIKMVRTTQQNFLKSTCNFIEFVNYLGMSSVRQYLNSKLSQLLIEKISILIKEIIHDDTNIKSLKQLIELCRLTNWNILSGFDNSNSNSIQDNLSKLYMDWMTDNYIDKVRKVFNSDLINATDTWEKEVPKEEVSTEEVSKEEEPKDDEDGWDDNWDDGWNDENIPASPKKENTQPNKTAVITISQVPLQLCNIINEFRDVSEDVSDMVSIIKALYLSKYPPLRESFLLYNDLEYLSEKLNIVEFENAAKTNWNQCLVTYYQQLRIIFTSLNLQSIDDVELDDEYFELDDYNLNQLSLIYKILNRLFQDTSLRSTNSQRFDNLIIDLIEFLNGWIVKSILSISEITEFQSKKITEIINSLNNVTIPFIVQLGQKKDDLKSYSKLKNVQFLLNNHLKEIMESFYEGELYDIETQELLDIIKSVFAESDVRSDAISQIYEFRTMDD